MPWVRIDENAMDHPKFLALTDGAWRLWCEGQAYCQKHLTDGAIPLSALKGFRYYSPTRLKNLLAEQVPGKGPCWHQDGSGSINVHDYLEWNDSRDEVLAARSDARDRRRRYRDRRASEDASPDVYGTQNVPSGVVCGDGEVPANGKRVSEKMTPLRERFERFWAVYPRKVGKDAAWRRWEQLKPDETFTDTAIATVQSQTRSVQWQKEGGQFIPHPATWLHQGRYLDEPDIPALTPADDLRSWCQHSRGCPNRAYHDVLIDMEQRDKAKA